MMKIVRNRLTAAATEIRQSRYPDAKAVFIAGSLVRGEGTITSDLDIVVVFERVEHAYRTSFIHGGWPVEIFAHDPETLEYFYEEVDRPRGIPSLASMVSEGLEAPSTTPFGAAIKATAKRHLDRGPIAWTQEEINASRYAITDLIEDLKAPRSEQEARATLTALYPQLATHYFRSRTLWTASSKAIPRALAAHNPEQAQRFLSAFDTAFEGLDIATVITLAAEILEPTGGPLFESYHRAAPAAWRKPGPKQT